MVGSGSPLSGGLALSRRCKCHLAVTQVRTNMAQLHIHYHPKGQGQVPKHQVNIFTDFLDAVRASKLSRPRRPEPMKGALSRAERQNKVKRICKGRSALPPLRTPEQFPLLSRHYLGLLMNQYLRRAGVQIVASPLTNLRSVAETHRYASSQIYGQRNRCARLSLEGTGSPSA